MCFFNSRHLLLIFFYYNRSEESATPYSIWAMHRMPCTMCGARLSSEPGGRGAGLPGRVSHGICVCVAPREALGPAQGESWNLRHCSDSRGVCTHHACPKANGGGAPAHVLYSRGRLAHLQPSRGSSTATETFQVCTVYRSDGIPKHRTWAKDGLCCVLARVSETADGSAWLLLRLPTRFDDHGGTRSQR